jgi:hypothetical protein
VEALLKPGGQLRVFADNNQRVYETLADWSGLQLAPIRSAGTCATPKSHLRASYLQY